MKLQFANLHFRKNEFQLDFGMCVFVLISFSQKLETW